MNKQSFDLDLQEESRGMTMLKSSIDQDIDLQEFGMASDDDQAFEAVKKQPKNKFEKMKKQKQVFDGADYFKESDENSLNDNFNDQKIDFK